jgi:hypothetical protein
VSNIISKSICLLFYLSVEVDLISGLFAVAGAAKAHISNRYA